MNHIKDPTKKGDFTFCGRPVTPLAKVKLSPFPAEMCQTCDEGWAAYREASGGRGQRQREAGESAGS